MTAISISREFVTRRVATIFTLAFCSMLGVTSGCESPQESPEALVAEAEGAASDRASKSPKAPDVYEVRFTTTEGDFVIEVNREWAPHGADRFHELVKEKFYDDVKFFRVVDDFVVQFGMSGDPKTGAAWRDRTILDDPVKQSNRRGYVTFATSGPNSRTTQVFINLGDNTNLDTYPGSFAPFGKVVKGMDVVEKLYSGYGEGAPGGRGPDQALIAQDGNKYLNARFPELDAVKTARVISENGIPVDMPEQGGAGGGNAAPGGKPAESTAPEDAGAK